VVPAARREAPVSAVAVALGLMLVTGCQDVTPPPAAAPTPPPARATAAAAPIDESQYRVVVDAATTLGPVMRFERATTHSTSSPMPGEPTRAYMQSLDHDLVRTWVQVRYVYNNGNVDYNYKYAGSNVGAEDAVGFYATTAKSVLIALSAYDPTSQWSLPTGQAFVDFLTTTLVHYKSRYPNVRYIQVGNEPDANDETMATYYPIYRQYYQAVNAANAQLGLTGTDRLLLSNGPFTSNLANMLAYADGFLAAYAADPDPAKKLDFFSFHGYGDTAQPSVFATTRQRLDAEMAKYGLPSIPIFVDEYGVFGGSTRPVRFTDADLVTMQPAGQLTKAFYMYEGGVDQVFNWAIYHSTLPMKSQVADVQTGVLYPYGNALKLARMVSDRETRLAASSKAIDANGLGTHVLASMKGGQGVAVLVWNFNWRATPPAAAFSVLVKNLPQSAVGGGTVHETVYVIDSKTNNVYTNPAQTSLQITSETDVDYASAIGVPLTLEPASVALVLLTPKNTLSSIDVQPAKISLTQSSTVSVYLYGTPTLNAATVSAADVRLHPDGTGAGAPVMKRGAAYFATARDYNGDGRLDQLFVFSTADLVAAGLTSATAGFTLRGPTVEATDAAPPTIVP